jgi:hypothetical protein
MPDYDPATTYILYSFDMSYSTIEDVNGNVYSNDDNNTYSNNNKTLNNICFNFSTNGGPPPPPSITSITPLSYMYFTEVILGTNVTTLINNAFENCAYLGSITIPSSVTSIGEDAFLSCVNLQSINIPSSVTSIGENAFSNCHSLKTVYIESDNPLGIPSPDNNNVSFFGAQVTTELPSSQTSDPGEVAEQSSHSGIYNVAWSGVDKTGATVTGTYAGSVNSTGDFI